jgi:hypothetical protein
MKKIYSILTCAVILAISSNVYAEDVQTVRVRTQIQPYCVVTIDPTVFPDPGAPTGFHINIEDTVGTTSGDLTGTTGFSISTNYAVDVTIDHPM